MTLALMVPVAATVIGCGESRDIFEAHNRRDTGQYEVVGREARDDGTVVLQVRAEKPEHARVIAEDLVMQNFAFSPKAMRVIVESAAGGPQQAFHWDPNGLRAETPQEAQPGAAPR